VCPEAHYQYLKEAFMIRSAAQARTPRVGMTTRSRNKQALRAEGTTKMRELGLMVLGAVLLILSAVTGYQVSQVSQDIAAYREELKAFGIEEERLMGEIDRLKSKKNLEKLGKSLGLHPPKKYQVVHLR